MRKGRSNRGLLPLVISSLPTSLLLTLCDSAQGWGLEEKGAGVNQHRRPLGMGKCLGLTFIIVQHVGRFLREPSWGLWPQRPWTEAMPHFCLAIIPPGSPHKQACSLLWGPHLIRGKQPLLPAILFPPKEMPSPFALPTPAWPGRSIQPGDEVCLAHC